MLLILSGCVTHSFRSVFPSRFHQLNPLVRAQFPAAWCRFPWFCCLNPDCRATMAFFTIGSTAEGTSSDQHMSCALEVLLYQDDLLRGFSTFRNWFKKHSNRVASSKISVCPKTRVPAFQWFIIPVSSCLQVKWPIHGYTPLSDK